MSSPHCRCSDGTCQTFPVEPVTGTGGVSIRRSVGANGANDPQDSKTIQDALNRVSASQGGAEPKLVVDGLPWAKTIAAIRKFQSRQSLIADGRVDPNGPTIARLNSLLASGTAVASAPIGVTPATMETLYSVVLPEVRNCVRAAEATLLLAWTELSFGSGGVSPGKNALALVNLHFAISQNPAWQLDLSLIQRVFRNMAALLNRNLSGVERTFQPFQGTVSATDLVTKRNAVAIAFSDGPSGGPPVKGRTLDGTPITFEVDKIYIMPPFQYQSPDGRSLTLIHEMSHYFGGAERTPNEIKDTRYGWRDALVTLTPSQKARNADCYSNFAFEARWNRPPMAFPS
jgi:hypothetical protein